MALAALIVAIVAASISGLTFVWTIFWSIYEHRARTKPDVKVKATLAFVPPHGEMLVSVSVTNIGGPPITLRGIAIAIKGRDEQLALIHWEYQSEPFNTTYKTGGSWDGLIQPDGIRAQLATLAPPRTKIRFEARDAADNYFRSQWREWDAFFGRT